jgi:hypothetical protein
MLDLKTLDKNMEQLSENIEKIAMYLLSNENVRKLIGNMSDDPLSESTPDVEYIFQNCVDFLPLFKKNNNMLNRINIVVTDVTNYDEVQTDYLDVGIRVDFLLPTDKWKIPSHIRPLLLMSEIQKSLGGYKIADLGSLVFDIAELIIPNDDQAGYSILYKIKNFK